MTAYLQFVIDSTMYGVMLGAVIAFFLVLFD